MSSNKIPWLSAMVLAGGAGSRMGGEKCSLQLEGRSLLDRTIDLLEGFSDEILLSSNTLEDVYRGYPVYGDTTRDLGPIGGLGSVLHRISKEAALVLPCDTPLIPPEVLSWLIASYRHKVTVLSVRGRIQPLCGVYPVSASFLIAKAIRENKLKLIYLLQELDADILELGNCPFHASPELFLTINTPDTLEQAAAILKVCGEKHDI